MQPAAIILPPGPRAQAGKGSFASRPLAAGEVLWRELPLLSLQVADSFNQLITLMSGISNFDDQFRRLEITANGTRYDLDALTDRCTRVMPA